MPDRKLRSDTMDFASTADGNTAAPLRTPTPEMGIVPRERAARPIDAGVDIGHVHLKASNLDRIRAFYVDILGFDVVFHVADALFIAAGGYHHTLGFNTWQSRGGTPPPAGTTGLYHVAIRYPTRAALGDALRRLGDARWPVDGFNDHGTHEAIYLRDPEENGHATRTATSPWAVASLTLRAYFARVCSGPGPLWAARACSKAPRWES